MASITDYDDATLRGICLETTLRITGHPEGSSIDTENQIAGIRGGGFTDPTTGEKYPAGWGGFITYLQNLQISKDLRARRGW